MIVIYAVESLFEKLNPKIPDPVLSSKNGEIKIKRYKNQSSSWYSIQITVLIQFGCSKPFSYSPKFIFRKMTGK